MAVARHGGCAVGHGRSRGAPTRGLFKRILGKLLGARSARLPTDRPAMSHYKIIFAGPVGAGKTTAVAAASDIPPVRTDAAASDEVRDIKPQTTVALDYGAMKLGDGSTIHLYGTPGQERFDFMWEILTEGGIALVLLIDNSRGDRSSSCASPRRLQRLHPQDRRAAGVTHGPPGQPQPRRLLPPARLRRLASPACRCSRSTPAARRRVPADEAVLSVIDPVAA